MAPCGISIPRPSYALLSSVVVEGLCQLISRKDTSRRGSYETITRVVKRGREPHWEIFMRRFLCWPPSLRFWRWRWCCRRRPAVTGSARPVTTGTAIASALTSYTRTIASADTGTVGTIRSIRCRASFEWPPPSALNDDDPPRSGRSRAFFPIRANRSRSCRRRSGLPLS